MSRDRVTGRLRLRRGREGRAEAGHLWVFAGEIEGVDGRPGVGELVDICTQRGRFLGRGDYSPRSRIRARILTHHDEPVDEAFLARRVESALALRRRVVTETTACRLVFGEGDRLPGLVVDRYGDVLVMQALTAGMDARRELLADLLGSLTGARAVYLRNDAKSRTLEGLPLHRGFVRGEAPTEVEIREAAGRFLIDIAGGQKTGWFCDQRENRLAAAALAAGAAVLDAFCYTGAFGIQAALAGAAAVLGLDASAEAVLAAGAHAARNGVADRCVHRTANAFDEFPRLQGAGYRCDVAVLDPPAFARSKAAVPKALAGYKELNRRALGLVRPEGFLVSCSCSWHVDEQTLWATVLDAARDAGRELRLIEFRSQARDHPMLAAMPETRYLKCLILQVF